MEKLKNTLKADYYARYGVACMGFAAFFKSLINSRELRAVVLYRLSSTMKNSRFRVPGVRLFLNSTLRSNYGLEIDDSACIGPGLSINHCHMIVVGKGVSIGQGCTLYHGVTLGARNKDALKDYPQVGDNVTFYAGSLVAGGVNIGDHSIIGAQALVLDDVPEFGRVFRISDKPR